jgi:UDP-N-acetylglucosamine 1-carboxyvinyltransferase
MSTILVRGRVPLAGSLDVAGSKNAALPLIAAAALATRPWRLTNVPMVSDVDVQLQLFERLGGRVHRNRHAVTLAMPRPPRDRLDPTLAKRLRASILFVPAMLARAGRAAFPHPGGCVIGTRPIDLFLEGFIALGARVRSRGEHYVVRQTPHSARRFTFRIQSHTGTEALLTLAAAIPGSVEVVNPASEPEVAQLADALARAGANIARTASGGYTVRGRARLGACTVRVIPDRIEAGTFLALAALTGPRVKIRGLDPAHLDVPLAYLERLGATVTRQGDAWHVRRPRWFTPVELRTHEYPGFPTDLQSPFAILLTQASGVSLIHETLYEGRLLYLDKLRAMGAKVLLADPHRAIVEGPTPLTAATIEGPDIRAGIALLLAGLIARGRTAIDHAEIIDRGYERIVERLTALGADLRRL